jgi:hypothetical protein
MQKREAQEKKGGMYDTGGSLVVTDLKVLTASNLLVARTWDSAGMLLITWIIQKPRADT